MAERVFLASGYGATTMQDVAREAGASKETLYRHFGSKEGLFAEIVGNRARDLRRDLDAEVDDPGAVDRMLHGLGANLLRLMTSPDVAAFFRMVVAETLRDPALGRLYYALGPGRTIEQLAGHLAAARDKGIFTGADPALSASIFVSAVVAHANIQCMLVDEPSVLSPEQIDARIREVVFMFKSAYLSGRPGRG